MIKTMLKTISLADLRTAFNDAQNRQMRYLAVTEPMVFEIKTDFSRPLEELVREVADQFFAQERTMIVATEEALLRQLRYDGLRPDGKPRKLVRLFDVTRDFEEQTSAEEYMVQNLSEAAQHAYARYLAEVERKYAPASQKNGIVSRLKRL